MVGIPFTAETLGQPRVRCGLTVTPRPEKSRRTLELPTQAAEALRTQHLRQARERLAAGTRWQDHGLVFASQVGTPLDASHVRRDFKSIIRRASLGENWTPRELRHSFVSLMSDHGVPAASTCA
jgi:site-specific recombinase XerD